MKANGAPEKLYFGESDKGILDIYSKKESDNEVEYTRTDAFIEKVSKWLEENAHLFVGLADENHPAIGDTKACYGTKSLIYYFKKEFKV